ncbi:GLUG motif-containing protein, partial [Acinetobacter sp. CIP 102129]|uniref:GLUG motif-containing protein n=1 Tax=Acinetobacter sp. CIP 102129 TaxID=1144664 RepID=UPI0002CF97F0
KGFWRVGALIGEANSTNTSNAFSTGQVNGYHAVGGLVGRNLNQSSILSSYSNAQVTATNSFAGGLSGTNENSSRIENSYATGAVQTQAQGYNSNAGGLSGINNSNSVIKNSYATGAVSGINVVGGLLGQNYSSTVENSYATGQVTRTSGSAITFGGLVGWYGGTIKNSYWNSATTGQTQAVGDNSGNLT